MPPLPQSTSRLRARQIIEDIAKSHGYLGEDVYKQMTPEVRRKVEEAMLKKDQFMGASVRTLSQNLYNSSARFVFELLQNADDNSYSRAKASSTDPYVSFRVYNRRIVVETNEDGFNYENLVAICNIDKSSKSGAQGYIGEKGIGFKSVFMVAWKALIQSGDFSFYFQHKKGDTGMGMITPIWHDAENDLMPNHVTRVTLFLHDSISADNMKTTLRQFQEIESTFLLFMKNLKKVYVTMYDENDEQRTFTTYSMSRQSSNLHVVDLKTEILKNGALEEYSKHYHLTRGIANDLSMSENRKYTKDEISRKAYQMAEVVLAFPLDAKSIPIIQPQDLFAFLPIRKIGFSFLIHTDFVTEASRQDISKSSARNIRLLDGIAETFIKAILQFVHHSTLRYQWMRYLPQTSDYPWDIYWGSLLEKIRYKLQEVSVLWTRSHNHLRPIKAMRRLNNNMLDEKEDPLFPDSSPERYLPAEYSAADLNNLNNYGLENMQVSEFLDKVGLDLDKGSHSIIKASTTSDDWHSRLAEFLISVPQSHSITIKSLGIIPLVGGEWKSFRDHPIYYSHVKEHPIPTDLGLKLVDPRAEKNLQRKRLFDFLSVKTQDISKVRRLILDKYAIPLFHNDFDRILTTSRNHLVFLYLTAHLDMANDWVESDCYRYRRPYTDLVYFSDNKPYGAHDLFQAIESIDHNKESQKNVPGLDVSFIHPQYMETPPSQPKGENRSWRTWLRDMLYIRDFIPIFATRGGIYVPTYHLSDQCHYVAEHRPEKLLGFLLEYWKESEYEKIDKTAREKLTRELMQVKVPCENGTKYPLGKTYLPIDEHKQRARRFIEDTEFFPWLLIEASLNNDASLSRLQVLATKFGFGYPKSDLEFYLEILRCIRLSNFRTFNLKNEIKIYELYGLIEVHYRYAADKDRCRRQIENSFNLSLIYVPPIGFHGACWAKPDQCLWEAPAQMPPKFLLQPRYKDAEYSVSVKTLFCEILKIPNASVDDLIEELTRIQQLGCSDFDQVCDIYKHIHGMASSMNDSESARVREEFEMKKLIYVIVDNDMRVEWYSVSECLWSTTTGIRGTATIREQYDDDMFDFFVEFLGVPTLTLEMIVDKLANQGAEETNTSVKDIKDTIWKLNALLKQEDKHPSPDRILKRRVFPVRYPGEKVGLCSSETDFAIADREHFSSLFCGKCKILDFKVNDIIRLEPFLEWTGMESRYLSRSVQEACSLNLELPGGYCQRLVAHDRDIALRAHGLLRIAVHFESPRVQSGKQPFYDQLQRIKVYETNCIYSQLELSQDGKMITVELGDKGELYFDDDKDEKLDIYVPRDKETQYHSFCDSIPPALFLWIMKDPKTGIRGGVNANDAVNAIFMVIQTPNKYVSTTLTRAGIMSVETPKPLDDKPRHIFIPRTRIVPRFVEKHDISTDSEDSSDWESAISVQDKRHARSMSV